jgi:hypothetical protein
MSFLMLHKTMMHRTGNWIVVAILLATGLLSCSSKGSEETAGDQPTDSTASLVTPHRFLWQSDGNSPTRGRGSIHRWPRLSSGTATCDLSQVHDNSTLPSHAPLGESTTLHFIEAICTGGFSGGTIEILVDMEDRTLDGIGNFGFFWYQPSVTISSAVTVDMTTTPGFSQFFEWNWATGAIGRRMLDGWNPITWQAGDHVANVGAASMTQTFVAFRILLQLLPNTTGTFYFSDLIHGYYAKPHITIWGENNFASVYTDLFPHASSRRLVGSYCPVTEMLKDPSRVVLEGGFTNAQLHEMVAAGWTIGGESTEGLNYVDFYTLDGAEADMDQHLADLQILGYRRPIFWCYEDAKHNAALDALLAARNVVAAFSGNIFSDNTGRSLYGGLVDPYNLWAVSGDAEPLANVIAAIDHAVKYGGQLGLEYQRYDQNFPAVADYLVQLRDAGLVEITTVEELIQRWKNNS